MEWKEEGKREEKEENIPHSVYSLFKFVLPKMYLNELIFLLIILLT